MSQPSSLHHHHSPTTTTKMQFTSILLAAIAAVSVSASPMAGADNIALPAHVRALVDAGETLEARQSTWCTACKNGKQTCCSAVACYPPYSC